MKQALKYNLLGLPAAYFLTSYFSNFYGGDIQFIIISLFFQLFCGITFSFFPDASFGKLKVYWQDHWLTIATSCIASSLPLSIAIISWKFPGLFDRHIISMPIRMFSLFLIMDIFAILAIRLLIKNFENNRVAKLVKGSKVFEYLQTNLTGIFLSILFFIAYFLLAQSLNFPGHNIHDQFFDIDTSQWIARFSLSIEDKLPSIRGVHPAVMLILRPPVWLISMFLNGNKLQASFVFSALAGALCVFLIWLIINKQTDNKAFSTISASILGASTSHLLLSSMMETYIFSALALITFCVLIQENKISFKSTIPVGMVLFGITVTNLVQACILYFLKKPRLKTISLFAFVVVILSLFLNVLQIKLFPTARPLYTSKAFLFETRYSHTPSLTSNKFLGRVNLVSRSLLLYGLVAPTPFILTEELGTNYPNFRTFRIASNEFHVAGYKGLPDLTVKIWIAMIGLAIILFMVKFINSPQEMSFLFSLILCMGFNFILHILYGDDPLLYSPNWVYALILFVFLSLGRWANSKWLQLGLTLFLGMVIYTNLGLVYQIMEVSLPFYGN